MKIKNCIPFLFPQANKAYLKKLKNINDKATQKMMEKVYKMAITGLEKSITEIEKQITLVSKSDSSKHQLIICSFRCLQ